MATQQEVAMRWMCLYLGIAVLGASGCFSNPLQEEYGISWSIDITQDRSEGRNRFLDELVRVWDEPETQRTDKGNAFLAQVDNWIQVKNNDPHPESRRDTVKALVSERKRELANAKRLAEEKQWIVRLEAGGAKEWAGKQYPDFRKFLEDDAVMAGEMGVDARVRAEDAVKRFLSGLQERNWEPHANVHKALLIVLDVSSPNGERVANLLLLLHWGDHKTMQSMEWKTAGIINTVLRDDVRRALPAALYTVWGEYKLSNRSQADAECMIADICAACPEVKKHFQDKQAKEDEAEFLKIAERMKGASAKELLDYFAERHPCGFSRNYRSVLVERSLDAVTALQKMHVGTAYSDTLSLFRVEMEKQGWKSEIEEQQRKLAAQIEDRQRKLLAQKRDWKESKPCPKFDPQIFPLAVGNTWVYSFGSVAASSKRGTWTDRIERTDGKNGYCISTTITLSSGKDVETKIDRLWFSEDGLCILNGVEETEASREAKQLLEGLSGRHQEPPEEEILLPYCGSCEHAKIQKTGGYPVKITRKILPDTEVVTVPAGTFTCVVMREVTGEKEHRIETLCYFASGVGLVKRVSKVISLPSDKSSDGVSWTLVRFDKAE